MRWRFSERFLTAQLPNTEARYPDIVHLVLLYPIDLRVEPLCALYLETGNELGADEGIYRSSRFREMFTPKIAIRVINCLGFHPGFRIETIAAHYNKN